MAIERATKQRMHLANTHTGGTSAVFVFVCVYLADTIRQQVIVRGTSGKAKIAKCSKIAQLSMPQQVRERDRDRVTVLIQFWQLLLSYLCVCVSESYVSSLNVCWINLAIFLLLFSFASVFLLFFIYYFSFSSPSSSSSSTVAAIFSLSISFGFAFVHLFSVHCSRFGLREFSIEFDILKFLPIPLRHRYCLDYMSSNNNSREREKG